MDRSHIVNEEHKFVRFNTKGETKLVTAEEVVPGFNYRRVHYTREGLWTQKRIGNQVFSDPQYTIDKSQLSLLDYKNKNVVLKRLYELYQYSPKNQKPSFFPKQNFTLNRRIDHTDLPPFVTQIGIFPIEHYKSLFLTQEFVSHGLYEIIINQNGRFETDVVDDLVPVYEDTLEPIWGMDIEHGWLIILLKFWAKKNKSYLKVKQIPPFQFIQFFTNSNWKYFNLHKQGFLFLNNYVGKKNHGKFVLKTKNTNQVLNAGLIPNSAGYEMVSLVETTGKQEIDKKKWIVTVKSTLVNRWAGQMSVLDKQLNKKYNSTQYKMQLQRDFMMNHIDFLNLFSSAYISSRRQSEEYFSDYYLISVPPENKRSIYLKFNITQRGFFDFCIKQFDDTRVSFTNNKSKIRADKSQVQNDGKRFLKMRYILVRDTTTGENDNNKDSNAEYFPPKFDTYEIQYSHGYNRGDARFVNIIPATYYLKIKPEKYSSQTKFVVNYACNTHIQMEQVDLTKEQKGMILRQAMTSMFDQLTSYSLDREKLYEQISFANLFDQVGYGFVAIRMKKSCPYKILIEIDPQLVKQSGYKLKNQFKNMTHPFSILVSRGQSTSVVLKKVNPQAQWPPQGIQIFRERQN